MPSSGAPDWVRASRDLYLVAIAVFVVNIVIGILNGADAVEFDRNQILTHVHAGTVHAPDAELAMQSARDLFTRRAEGVSLWVVRSSDITASDPDDRAAMFDPALDKTFRHPTDFVLPDEVANM